MARSSNMIVPELLYNEGIRELKERMEILTSASRGTVTLSYDSAFLAQFGGDFTEPFVFARPSGGVQHSDEADPTNAVTAAAIAQAQGSTVNQTNFAYYGWTRDE